MAKVVEAALGPWKFSFSEGGLSPSEDIEAIAQQHSLFRAPTIVFNSNRAIFTQTHSGVTLLYDAATALKFINYKAREATFVGAEGKPEADSISYVPERLFVKHAEHWKTLAKPKDIEITEMEDVSDSFFLTPSKGHISGNVKIERVHEPVIPVQKLGPTNPITFYQQGSFYEDQLDDNGLIQYEYKFRTMANSWFALIRNYARVDQVAVLVYDTRLYWEEGWKKVARQFQVKRASWEELKQRGFEFPPGWTMNPNQSHLLYPHLQELFNDNEYIHFG